MTGMQRPTVVRGYEVPILDGPSVRDRVVVDIGNCTTNFIEVIEEDFPPAFDPHWMVGCAKSVRAKPQAAVVLKVLDHLFCLMLMFSDDEVDMIAQDCTCVAGIFEPFDCVPKSVCDTRDGIEIQL